MCVVTPEEMQPPEGNFLLNLSKLGCMSSSLFYRFVQILQHAAAILSWVNLFINFIILKKLAFYFCSMTYNNKVYSGLLKELLIFLKKRLWTQYFLDHLIFWKWITLLLFIIRLSFFYFFIIIYCIAKRSVKEIQHCFTVHNCARWISTLLSPVNFNIAQPCTSTAEIRSSTHCLLQSCTRFVVSEGEVAFCNSLGFEVLVHVR